MCAGVQGLDFYLKPNEKIRTASVLVYDYVGERTPAHNVWRKLLKDYFALETKYGNSMNVYACWGGQSDEYLIDKADKFASAGFSFDIGHFDAGWYGKCPVATSYVWDDGNEHSGLWAEHVGDWKMNEILHPNFMKESVEETRRLAKYIGFWSEFERAHKNSDTVKTHPEYYFKTMLGDNYLVNLGSEEGYNYAWESITYIASRGLGEVLAVDFTVTPLEAFEGDDEVNRKGICQTQHVLTFCDPSFCFPAQLFTGYH